MPAVEWRANIIDYSISFVISHAMGRPSKPKSEKARNAGFTLYPREITALEAAALGHKLKTSSDFIRRAVINFDDPRTRGKINSPRRARENQTPNSGPVPGPNSAPRT